MFSTTTFQNDLDLSVYFIQGYMFCFVNVLSLASSQRVTVRGAALGKKRCGMKVWTAITEPLSKNCHECVKTIICSSRQFSSVMFFSGYAPGYSMCRTG